MLLLLFFDMIFPKKVWGDALEARLEKREEEPCLPPIPIFLILQLFQGPVTTSHSPVLFSCSDVEYLVSPVFQNSSVRN